METLEQTRTRIEAIIREKAPDVDLTPGSVLSELLTNLSAVAQTEVYARISEIEAAKVVQDVLSASTDTYSETIDRLASNYDTYRNEGKKANGQLKVLVSQAKPYFIPDGLKFIQPNLNFEYTTVTSYTIKSSGTPVELKQEGSVFYFVIPVEAVEIGKDKQVAHGTRFTVASSTALPEFVDAFSFGAFALGEDKETDRELIARFRLGLSTKTLVTPYAMEAVLKDRYPSFKSVAVCGSSDPEMLRGRNNPLGIRVPGLVDVYVRMGTSMATVTKTLAGTKITSGTHSGKWQVAVDASAAPGFYKVLSIVKKASTEAGTINFTAVTYGYDETQYERKNSLDNAAEARFSKYQTCVVIFPYSAGSGVTELDFDVTFMYQPYIAEIQHLFLSDAERIPCADYLVKGVVPCNTSVSLKLVKNSALDQVDVGAVKADVFNYVNTLPMGEPVSASKIVNLCHKHGINRVELPVKLSGSILVPNSETDETLHVSSSDLLRIPSLPAKGVTAGTTAFFINYFDETGLEAIKVEIA